ncbi:MAG: sulfatase [Planctomycetota bacterium]
MNFLVASLLLAGSLTPPNTDRLLLKFRAEAVDGVDDLVLTGKDARIEHREYHPITGANIEVAAEVPAESVRVVVRARQGRPRVSVLQQPSATNGFEVRVRIDDGPAPGAAPLSFELWAVPAEAFSALPVPRPLDVVVITIDSLRPDHLGCYGYARSTSPALDAFAKTAVLYERAFSSSSFTPPSHATMLTSRHVGDHGLLTWNAMPDEQITLPEILSAHGYRTGASVNLRLLSEQNLGQGVEWRREGGREARRIVDDALEFLREDDPRPIFLWLHLYDVHRPYGGPRGWRERFAAQARPGVGDVEDHYNLEPEDVAARSLAVDDLRYVADRYDAGIAYADAQLAPLLAELSTPQRLAKTLVVLSADHGESLLDHGERLFSHDPFLYTAVTRIPLLVRYPDAAGGGAKRPELTGLIDVAPTVLAQIGIAAPLTFQGGTLAAPGADPAVAERELYHECWGWSRLAAIRTSAWLVVRDMEKGSTQAFDLARDPHEVTPLDPRASPVVAALAKRLGAFADRSVPLIDPPLDPELRKRLEALGYTDR